MLKYIIFVLKNIDPAELQKDLHLTSHCHLINRTQIFICTLKESISVVYIVHFNVYLGSCQPLCSLVPPLLQYTIISVLVVSSNIYVGIKAGL